ncbi:sulfite exporter TauE/SafE family protein [Oceaniglobus ichthyenteri]|uniref:sulfite exporter TauE/SafE family protein n=1 Tax=Oceaniglobus ichthyenteri TaxID=2136177 RepID=UPI001F0CCE41|nr:sulfite exporter TauE/SafE family protein [Oceaniglobus ichthyenteri]
MSEYLVFFVSGILGGAVNAAAGGAKLFVFPMLVATGLPPLAANATAAVGLWPAQLSAVWANRQGLFANPRALFLQMLPAMLGALAGAFALIFSTESAFLAVIPALLFVAVAAILMGRRLSAVLQRLFPGGALQKVTHVLMFAVGFYGGYFGAGLGFMLIAVLTAAGGLAIQKANTLKNLTAFSIYSVAVIPLSFSGLVVWDAAMAVLVGGLIGGYVGARVVKHLPDTPMRVAVAGLGCVLVGAYLFRL